MNTKNAILFACLLFSTAVGASPSPSNASPESAPARRRQTEATPSGGFNLREVRYEGRLSDDEARFTVDLDAEAVGKGESSAKLFEGDVAILPAKLSDQLRIVRKGSRYLLVASHPGHFKFSLDLVARIQRAAPWNQVSFTGPSATIVSVCAQASGKGMEVQLLSGTLLDSSQTNGLSRVKGFLGADQTVALRWQSKVAEVARKTLLTVDSTIAAQLTPAVIKYTSRFHYDIVQGNAAQLILALPDTQALTRLVGEQIRDWHTRVEAGRQILTIEFIKPVEAAYDLTLYSEQTVATTPPRELLNPPQPLEVERESGAISISAEDAVAEIESLAGLRQVNAAGGALAAYRFNARPFSLALTLKRIEPEIHAADRVTARLEEARLIVSHRITLDVAKAGIYALELLPQAGLTVADVRGDGIEDWKVSGGSAPESKRLHVSFVNRVLGPRRMVVQLEQALKSFPEKLAILPLRISGAARETAEIGAASAPGIQIKTAELSGLRAIPVDRLSNRADELLAYTAEQPDWKLTLAGERLAPRIVADVFNLVTIGDGIVGGSATIRYSLVNQGVQEFKVRLPAQCRNVEFTGPNIRSREESGGVWTLGLQDKAWNGYTLVVTYDYQFDPHGATLPMGGIHTVDVERETGSVALTTAASLQLNAQTVSETLRRLDETELPAADRALISRAVVLAYQYTGAHYDLDVNVKRYSEEPVLEAVADRTQITSVLTEAGEMLTQASFMVKNNEKQFQGFQLPKGATLWGCYVNGQPAKPEHSNDWLLVPIPRDANRDQAFAVDITHAQTNSAPGSRWGKSLVLTAPRTDVPNTYAEWQLFVPPTLRLSGFGGTMKIAQGTTYELLDAWEKFLGFYVQVLREMGGAILGFGALAVLVIALVVSAARRGWNGILTVLAVITILAVLGAMLLPALSKAKARAQRISSVNDLKRVGLAARIFSGDNGDRLPVSFEEMANELNTDKITYDAETGQRFTYIGAGLSLNDITPDSVIAYGPIVNNECNVLMADGSVQSISAARFYEMNQHGLIHHSQPLEVAAEQKQAVLAGQLAASDALRETSRLAVRSREHPTLEPGMALVPNGVTPASVDNSGSPAPAASTNWVSTGSPAGAATPTVAGIRSIRIELPQTGQPFLFTKVLNVGNQALAIRAKVMPYRAYQTMQMAWQTAAFLLGLLVWWWQWRRIHRNTFVLTLALAIILGSVTSLLIQWRALHDLLIIGFPIVTLGVIALLVWKYWPRGNRAEPIAAPAPEPIGPHGSLPPVVAAMVLCLALGIADSRGDDSAFRNVSITSASYTGTVNDRVALVEVTLQVFSGKAGQTLPLFGAEVAVQQFEVKHGDATLLRDGGNLAVRIEKRGDVMLQIKMLAKVAGDVTRRKLAFAIPSALSSEVALTLDQPEAEVDFPTAISFKRTLDHEKTRVEAVIGSGDRLELAWTPRVKRAEEMAATVFCRNQALVTFGGGVMNVRDWMDFQVTQGELRQARIQLPVGQRLLRVEGAGIRTWKLNDQSGSQELVVDLIRGATPDWRLTVETDQALEALPAAIAVAVPHALEVKRETGLVALRSAEELGLSVESASDLQRVDVEEFKQTDADKTGNLASVFRYVKTGFTLRVRAEAIQPQIEAVVRNNVRVDTDSVALSSAIDYTIKRAGVFALKVALPEGYQVEQVTGDNVMQWNERTDAAVRQLEVTLKERTLGGYALKLELMRNFSQLPKSLAILGVYPMNAAKLTGFIRVSAEPGVALRTESMDGLTEIPATDLPDGSTVANAASALAYKFISSEPKSLPDWKLAVTTETVQAWVRAEVFNAFAIGDSLINGKALVRFDIANAPIKELRVKVPATFRNVEITGDNIRSRGEAGGVWNVEFQSKMRGIYLATITWDQPRSEMTNAELTGVSAAAVERETGWIAVVAKAPLQVTESKADDLQRVDMADLPDWAGPSDNATVFAYRYVRPGYQLVVGTRRFHDAQVLQALVDNAHFTTVVADDGQQMTQLSLSIRNHGRQFLEVELPRGATVWSAFVAGQPVRPSVSGGKLLLPIQQTGDEETPLAIDLTYVDMKSFPRKRGELAFNSPKFDVPLKNARWELFLPPDYDYQDLSGTMMPEAASLQPDSTVFSRLEYTRMEQANKDSLKAELSRDVDEARRQLAGGNVREATATFNRAKGNAYGGGVADKKVRKLELDLQSAQASNLIHAQNDFSIRNGNSGVEAGKAPAEPALLYDNNAAQEQWQKLQQAQAIVAATVQPLRINLPIRGLRHAFTQVLQTEINKPLTIRLLAASTHATSWPKRIGTGVAAFLALWIAVAFLANATRRQLY